MHLEFHKTVTSYSSDYRGTTVSQMNEMDVNDTLTENGFLSNDLVFCFDSSMTEDYKSRLRSIENKMMGHCNMLHKTYYSAYAFSQYPPWL